VIAVETVLTLEDVTLTQAGPSTFPQAAFDSRKMEPGSLFFALEGARDGHEFITSAVANGATGVVVSQPVEVDDQVAVFTVPNTLVALQQLGLAHRRTFDGLVIAITGSVGKTTLRGMITEVLATRHDPYASKASFNNHIGVPLTLLGIDINSHSHAIVEVGTNSPGEIGPLSELIEADVSIVSNVGFAHIGNFESQTELAAEKADLLQGTATGGSWVVNGDDHLITSEMAKIDRGDVTAVKVGSTPSNDVSVTNIAVSERGTTCQISHNDETHELFMPLHGRHFASAAGIALAVGQLSGVSLPEGIAALAESEPQRGRAMIERLEDQLIVIDDSYNASPDAMMAGLHLLDDLGGRTKIAVLGEMRELGEWNKPLHVAAGELAATVADHIIAIGEGGVYLAAAADQVVSTAPTNGGRMASVTTAGSATEAYEVVEKILAGVDGEAVVLVKGSRFAHTERVVLGLKGRRPACRLGSCQLYINCETCDRLQAVS